MTLLIWLLLYGAVGVALVREVTKRTTRDPLDWPWWGIALISETSPQRRG
jgi:hypothetical protein